MRCRHTYVPTPSAVHLAAQSSRGAGLHTGPLFKGLPDDQCQCPHWGYMIRGTIRVHTSDGSRDFETGEAYYWPPGHNLEAVTDCEYLEITPAREFDALMEHVASTASS